MFCSQSAAARPGLPRCREMSRGSGETGGLDSTGASLMTKEKRGREQVVHGDVSVLRRASRLLDEYGQPWRQRALRIEDLLAEAEGEQEGVRACRSPTCTRTPRR